MNIYPNPAIGFVTIETVLAENSILDEVPEMKGMRLVSANGKLVFHTNQVFDHLTIPLAGVPPGIYTLQTTILGEAVSEMIEVKAE